MSVTWLFTFLFIIQQVTPQAGVDITKDGKPISTINREDYAIGNPSFFILDTKKYNKLLNQLEKQLSVIPKDARLDQHENIIPEQAGLSINRQAFTESFYSFFFEQNKSTLEIPMYPVYPKVDSELLSDIRSIRIGRYITSFNPRNKKRSTNIQLAVEAINNHVVFPGDTFSFNSVVGKRTTEKGYEKAKVIVKGEYAEDIGGGICQVSSTLFNAVDSAGLKIVQRFSHSRHVPYIPPGRDATVSWYGPDFEFKNMYNQPILIQAKTIGNLLVIKLYSSEVIEYKPKKVPFPTL
ncbi:VanW family protein [Bacillus sp. EB106-08-02-XG196]|uniref:VanW family protein n=1 Tax=Bacillus sp. EB106-08-02-XG196 TaxID=2737049 RepID=UPI0015C41785|nr:VanW family protein [Bacillus sp. EB106-08-02-XG196]NWQ41989.1 VanW family protein [Bacillus sp. EB106-08-02-XG196]